jgi:hypothetical protein
VVDVVDDGDDNKVGTADDTVVVPVANTTSGTGTSLTFCVTRYGQEYEISVSWKHDPNDSSKLIIKIDFRTKASTSSTSSTAYSISGSPATTLVAIVDVSLVRFANTLPLDTDFEYAGNLTLYDEDGQITTGFSVTINSVVPTDNGDGTSDYDIRYTVTYSAAHNPDSLNATFHADAFPSGAPRYPVAASTITLWE